MPQLWVVAGPNGTGKSTLTGRYLVGRLPIVNPDTIAQKLDPANPTRARVRVRAGREAIRRQEALLTQAWTSP
jgi:predicted ABC-type ATPase